MSRLNANLSRTDTGEVSRTRSSCRRALIPLVAVAAGSLVMPSTAGATDLDELRKRAQQIGDEVSTIEGELDSLRTRKAELEDEIVRSSQELGALELAQNQAEDRYDEALATYVARAVEAYKAGPSRATEMLVAAQDLTDLMTLDEVSERVAELDAAALEELVANRQELEVAQEVVDERKQKLLSVHAEVSELESATSRALSSRRRRLAEMNTRIAELEAEARRQAALAAVPSEALLQLLSPSGPARGIPKGFVGTGVSFSGIASWYGPGFEGNSTASGDVFDPDLFTAASKELPFGTWLFVSYNGSGVVVLVNDRGPYIDDRVLDLSQAAAESIGLSGIGWVDAEILLKTRD